MPKNKIPLPPRKCANDRCDKVFQPEWTHSKYCCHKCEVQTNNRKRYPAPTERKQNCLHCGAEFIAIKKDHNYCSINCNQQAKRERRREEFCKEQHLGKFGVRVCARIGCGIKFRTWHRAKIYCSARCQYKATRQNVDKSSSQFGLSPMTVGAIGEFRICIDLLERGFEVFRSVSPNCSCDLVALGPEGMVRIEVKTGKLNTETGSVYGGNPNDCRADVLAVACRTGEIRYRPLKEWVKCQKDWISVLTPPTARQLEMIISGKS